MTVHARPVEVQPLQSLSKNKSVDLFPDRFLGCCDSCDFVCALAQSQLRGRRLNLYSSAGRSLAAVSKNPFRQKGPTAGDFHYTAFVE